MINRYLKQPAIFIAWASIACFCAYFCMYMFRKPCTAATFTNKTVFGFDYKILLVISQVMGYAISKFIGIKFISELKHEHRIKNFIVLIIVSWLSLAGFSLSSGGWSLFWMFLNGLPLGMIWGIVFTFCEGRKFTEILTVFLSVNFIIASGVAKTLGRWVILQGVSEELMPFVIGSCFLPLLGFSLWMLSKIPRPDERDIALRTKRRSMTNVEKQAFLKGYWFPILLFVITYLMLTIIRDVRDNFAVEIWSDLGFSGTPQIFSITELQVTIFILFSLGFLFLVKQNKKALNINLIITGLGLLFILLVTFSFINKYIDPVSWMIITGIGLFLPYILLNGIIFDRFIAHFKISGNVGFMMYISDAIGYMGSIVILLIRNFGEIQMSWLQFYIRICLAGSITGMILVVVLISYIYYKSRRKEEIKITPKELLSAV